MKKNKGKIEDAGESPKKQNTQVEDIKKDILSKLPSDIIRQGFVVRVWQTRCGIKPGQFVRANRGSITSAELDGRFFEDVLLQRFGDGEFHAVCFTNDGKRIEGIDPYDIAVGEKEDDVNAISRRFPEKRNSSERPPSPQSLDPVRFNADVIAKKSELEIKRLELEEIEINQKKKQATGGDGNSSLERIVTSLGQSFKDSITQLATTMAKPSDNNAELKRELAEMKSKLDTTQHNQTTELIMKSMESTNKMMIESIKTQAEQQRASDQRFSDMMLKIMADKKSEQMSLTDMFQFVMKADTYRRRNEEDSFPEIIDRPEKEESFFEKIANSAVIFLNKLNQIDPALIASWLQRGGTPQPNPVPDKKYTEAELQDIADKLARETIEKYKRDNPDKKPVIDAEKVSATPDVISDKKNRVNEVLKRILVEIKIKPTALGWMSDAYDNLPEETLDKIAVAKVDTEILSAISQYADEGLIGQLKTELMTGIDPISMTSANIQWLADGVKVLREMIAFGVDDDGNIMYPKPEQK